MPTTIELPQHKALKFKQTDAKRILVTKRPGPKAETPAAGSLSDALQIRDQIATLQKQLAALQVAEAPKVILPELHDKKTGRIDAQKVADFMGVPLKPLAEGLGLNYKAVHRNPSASGFQEALQPVKRSMEMLHEFFGPKETIRIWLNTPHPDLDGATSLDTILEGKAFAVSRILGNAWNGVPL